MDPTLEQIGPLRLWISREHRFGTDAFLLAHFSAPRRGDRACDLCSGCGIIPVLWLRREAAPAAAYAVELLPQPIALLERTVRENALEGRLLPICRDLRELGPGDIPTASLDLVTCNPPYNGARPIPPPPCRPPRGRLRPPGHRRHGGQAAPLWGALLPLRASPAPCRRHGGAPRRRPGAQAPPPCPKAGRHAALALPVRGPQGGTPFPPGGGPPHHGKPRGRIHPGGAGDLREIRILTV